MKRHQRSKVDGYPVVDATKPLEVHVTQRDIRKGKPSACDCAFAVAIRRTYGAERVRVNASRVYVEQGGVYRRYRTPEGMFEQIELFDRTGDMGPGVYTIPVMSPSHALGVVYYSRRRPRLGSHDMHPLKKRDRPIYKAED
jgi:hypothetical protein